MLKGKNILLGITGGIAAYKAAILVRLLVKKGADVKIVMSPIAKEFITPLTLATLSKHPILVDFYDPENGDWNSHVDLGLWADAYLIAPATANSMSKMAYGIADNLLLTTYLSAKCPVFFAPTMDLDMYKHEATQKSITTLKKRGHICIEPGSGELASGLIGKGRMEEPEEIVKQLEKYFSNSNVLAEKNVLITAGPTYEAIDPVRFIGNHSSGKMGYALAEELANKGAKVKLISGKVSINPQHSNIERITVTSAEEMYNSCIKYYNDTNIAIFAAAVADYKPRKTEKQKIKKKKENLIIELVPNPDIALKMGKLKKDKQINIGFALETDNDIEKAIEKLEKKNFDLIIYNTLSDSGAGFGHDTNKVIIIDKNKQTENIDLKSKKELAKDIVNKIIEQIKQ